MYRGKSRYLVRYVIIRSAFLTLDQRTIDSPSITGVDITTGRRDAVAWAEKHRTYAETGIYTEEEDESVDAKEYGKRA